MCTILWKYKHSRFSLEILLYGRVRKKFHLSNKEKDKVRMDALIQDLERHFQFCVPNIKRRKEDTSSASVLTSKARGNSTTEVVACGSHFTTSNVSDSGSKCVRSTAQLMGQTAMVKSDKDRQENVRK